MAAVKLGRGVNRKGRSKKGGKFVRLGDGLLTSEAWRSLSGPTLKYYLELRRRFNGTNNGEILLGLDEAKTLLHIGKTSAFRAQQELEDKGFIRKTREGGFHQRVAATWALTDETSPGSLATHDYKKWVPQKRTFGPETERTRSPDGTKNPKSTPRRSSDGTINGGSEHSFGPETEHF